MIELINSLPYTSASQSFVAQVGVTRDPATVDAIFDRIGKLAAATRSLRCLGSCALNLCRCAGQSCPIVAAQKFSRFGCVRHAALFRMEQDCAQGSLVWACFNRLSTCIKVCSVAMGRLDAFYEIGFGGPWDVAAAALILEEAGGQVADPAGGPFDLQSRRVLGANGQLLRRLAEIIASAKCSPAEPQP